MMTNGNDAQMVEVLSKQGFSNEFSTTFSRLESLRIARKDDLMLVHFAGVPDLSILYDHQAGIGQALWAMFKSGLSEFSLRMLPDFKPVDLIRVDKLTRPTGTEIHLVAEPILGRIASQTMVPPSQLLLAGMIGALDTPTWDDHRCVTARRKEQESSPSIQSIKQARTELQYPQVCDDRQVIKAMNNLISKLLAGLPYLIFVIEGYVIGVESQGGEKAQ
jgi:hypothetical protein